MPVKLLNKHLLYLNLYKKKQVLTFCLFQIGGKEETTTPAPGLSQYRYFVKIIKNKCKNRNVNIFIVNKIKITKKNKIFMKLHNEIQYIKKII